MADIAGFLQRAAANVQRASDEQKRQNDEAPPEETPELTGNEGAGLRNWVGRAIGGRQSGSETPSADTGEPASTDRSPRQQRILAYVSSQDRPSHGEEFEPASDDDKRWMGAFAREHDGRLPSYEDYYDRLWSIQFARQTGRSPEMNDWRTHYYVKYSDNDADTAVSRTRYETREFGWEPAQPLRVYDDDFGPWSISDRASSKTPTKAPTTPAATPPPTTGGRVSGATSPGARAPSWRPEQWVPDDDIHPGALPPGMNPAISVTPPAISYPAYALEYYSKYGQLPDIPQKSRDLAGMGRDLRNVPVENVYEPVYPFTDYANSMGLSVLPLQPEYSSPIGPLPVPLSQYTSLRDPQPPGPTYGDGGLIGPPLPRVYR